jgi:hypothetical protein
MPLMHHPAGNYQFLPGISPYSAGVVAAPGFEIVHVTFVEPPPCRVGFERIAAFLEGRRRPRAALCALELRSPRPFTFEGFADFNAEYAETLRSWDVFVDGINPVARTNVAPIVSPPAAPVIHAFSFTQPVEESYGATFVVAGAGELPEGVLARDSIAALGDASPAGLRAKAAFVLGLMEGRLRGLGVDSAAVTAIDVYTAHDFHPLMEELILRRLPAGARQGVAWHFARPPISEVEFEMDVRGVRGEWRI